MLSCSYAEETILQLCVHFSSTWKASSCFRRDKRSNKNIPESLKLLRREALCKNVKPEAELHLLMDICSSISFWFHGTEGFLVQGMKLYNSVEHRKIKLFSVDTQVNYHRELEFWGGEASENKSDLYGWTVCFLLCSRELLWVSFFRI